MAEYVIMPKADYESACDATRAKTGKTDLIKSGELATEISGITGSQQVCVVDISEGDSPNDNVVVRGFGVKEVNILHESTVLFASACFEVVSGTEATGSISATKGNWVLATVTTRSDTTFSDGWTVLRRSTVLSSDASNQRMFFLCREVTESGTQSITVTQSTSGRIYINLIVAKGASGFAYHDGTEDYNDQLKLETVTVTRPEYPLLVWACSAVLWNNSSPYGTWTCDGLSPICLDGELTQPRQANFVDRGESVSSRSFVCNSSGGTHYLIDCVEVLV